MQSTDPVSGRGAIGYHVGVRRVADCARRACGRRDGAGRIANVCRRACAHTRAPLGCCVMARGAWPGACGGEVRWHGAQAWAAWRLGQGTRATSDVLLRCCVCQQSSRYSRRRKIGRSRSGYIRRTHSWKPHCRHRSSSRTLRQTPSRHNYSNQKSNIPGYRSQAPYRLENRCAGKKERQGYAREGRTAGRADTPAATTRSQPPLIACAVVRLTRDRRLGLRALF